MINLIKKTITPFLILGAFFLLTSGSLQVQASETTVEDLQKITINSEEKPSVNSIEDNIDGADEQIEEMEIETSSDTQKESVKRSDELKEIRDSRKNTTGFIFLFGIILLFGTIHLFAYFDFNKYSFLLVAVVFIGVFWAGFSSMEYNDKIKASYHAALLAETIDIYKEEHNGDYPVTEEYLFPGEKGLVYSFDFDELVKINYKLADESFKEYGIETETGDIYSNEPYSKFQQTKIDWKK